MHMQQQGSQDRPIETLRTYHGIACFEATHSSQGIPSQQGQTGGGGGGVQQSTPPWKGGKGLRAGLKGAKREGGMQSIAHMCAGLQVRAKHICNIASCWPAGRPKLAARGAIAT